MPSEHAKFSPSSMKRVMACPASYALEHGGAATEARDTGSKASREGTIAHALGEACLRKGVDPKAYVGKPLVVDLDDKVEKVTIEKDMADKVAIYVEHCAMLAMLADRRMVEQEVHVATTVGGEAPTQLLWGTADFIAISPDRIDVVDLKFGGMVVEPENNPQLVAYLLGALELLPADARPNVGAVHIVQPKLSSEPKIWEIEDLAALRAEWLPRFEAAMGRALEASATATPGDEHYQAGAHCHFCPALVECEHFARHVIDLTAAELEEIEPAAAGATAPTPIDAGRYAVLVERWRAKSTVKHYFELLEDRLAADLRKGVDVPGLKLVEAKGHRKWALDDADMMGRLRNQGLKKADFITEKLVSPAAVEKLIDNPRFFQKYVVRPTSEKLVDMSDKRPATNHGALLKVIEPVEFNGGKCFAVAVAERENIGKSDFAYEVWTTADGVSHAKAVGFEVIADQFDLDLGEEIEL